MRRAIVMFVVFGFLALPGLAAAKKVYLNPSDQTNNPVSGGGNEAQYALINAKLAKPIIAGAGHSVVVDQDFYNAPKNANSWGADVFVSIHSNAGGGHGIETLYLSNGGKVLAGKVNNGLLAKLPYQNRGLKLRTDLHVLNSTNMYACLTEVLFHDCTKTSGYQGHPPSESAFLRSASGQAKIAAGIASGTCSYFGTTCASTGSTKGFLKGVVYKAPNMDDRIGGAKVKLNTGQSTVSSSSGAWSFELAPGKYTATATKDGYASNSNSGTVVAGQDVWASIGLTPKSSPEPDAGAPDAGPSDGGPSDGEPPEGADGEPPAGDWSVLRHSKLGHERPEEGCGCRLADQTTGPPLSVVLLALLLLLRRRRGA
jgi:N-acetylmuramoyl-L-alanine amidase